MDKFVKHIFTFIMWVFAAMILYFVFFGTYNLQGRSLENQHMYAGDNTQTQAWRGVLWYAALAAENPISKYYYEYCYVPNIHANDYVDEAVGGTATYGSLFTTTTDLSGASDTYTFAGAGHTCSTGWR